MPMHPPPEPPIEISVVVICFNQQDTIAAAVQSVLTQTAEKSIREIFVVDDCSTDASRAVADALAAQHPKLTVIARERGTAAAALRPAMTVCAGRAGPMSHFWTVTTYGCPASSPPRSRC
jgi:cellulose synthase/poly-beta-1,6-N-acetylglucosamine synthase-like glycosyltransferase